MSPGPGNLSDRLRRVEVEGRAKNSTPVDLRVPSMDEFRDDDGVGENALLAESRRGRDGEQGTSTNGLESSRHEEVVGEGGSGDAAAVCGSQVGEDADEEVDDVMPLTSLQDQLRISSEMRPKIPSYIFGMINRPDTGTEPNDVILDTLQTHVLRELVEIFNGLVEEFVRDQWISAIGFAAWQGLQSKLKDLNTGAGMESSHNVRLNGSTTTSPLSRYTCQKEDINLFKEIVTAVLSVWNQRVLYECRFTSLFQLAKELPGHFVQKDSWFSFEKSVSDYRNVLIQERNLLRHQNKQILIADCESYEDIFKYENESQTRRIDGVEKEIKAVLMQKAKIEEFRDRLLKHNQEILAGKNVLVAAHQELVTGTVDLQRQLRAANNTNSRPRDKNQRFENEIKLSKQKVAELEQRNNDLKITNKELRSSQKDSNAKNLLLTKFCSTVRNILGHEIGQDSSELTETYIGRLSDHIRDLYKYKLDDERRGDNSKSSILERERSLKNQLKEADAKLVSEREIFEQRLSAEKKSLNDEMKKTAEAEKRYDEFKKLVKKDTDALKAEKAIVEREKANLEQEISKKDMKIKHIREQNRKSREEFSQAENMLRASLEERKTGNTFLQRELDKTKNRLEASKELLQKVHEEPKRVEFKLKETLEEIFARNSIPQRDRSKSETELAKLKQETFKKEQEVESMRRSNRQNITSSDQLEDLPQGFLDDITNENLNLQQELDEAHEQISALEEGVLKAQAEYGQMQSERQENMNNIINENRTRCQELDGTEDKIKALEEKLEKAKASPYDGLSILHRNPEADQKKKSMERIRPAIEESDRTRNELRQLLSEMKTEDWNVLEGPFEAENIKEYFAAKHMNGHVESADAQGSLSESVRTIKSLLCARSEWQDSSHPIERDVSIQATYETTEGPDTMESARKSGKRSNKKIRRSQNRYELFQAKRGAAAAGKKKVQFRPLQPTSTSRSTYLLEPSVITPLVRHLQRLLKGIEHEAEARSVLYALLDEIHGKFDSQRVTEVEYGLRFVQLEEDLENSRSEVRELVEKLKGLDVIGERRNGRVLARIIKCPVIKGRDGKRIWDGKWEGKETGKNGDGRSKEKNGDGKGKGKKGEKASKDKDNGKGKEGDEMWQGDEWKTWVGRASEMVRSHLNLRMGGRPQEVSFTLRFHPEENEWKLQLKQGRRASWMSRWFLEGVVDEDK